MARRLGVCAAVLVALSPVVARADDGGAWSWVQPFRVWEPGGLVFLEPENWLQPQPSGCSGGRCRFTFSLEGRLWGIGGDSALAGDVRDGQRFSVEGDFYDDGTLGLAALRIIPDPEGGGGWRQDLVAVPELDASGNPVSIEHVSIASEGWELDGGDPVGAPGACPEPPCLAIDVGVRLQLRLGAGEPAYLSPAIRFVFADPGGTLSLSNLHERLSQLRSVRISSVAVTASGRPELWRATVSGVRLVTAPRYGRDLLRASFDLDAIGAAPSASPSGPPSADAITLQNGGAGGNSILVQGRSASFPGNSLRVVKAAGVGNSPIVEGHPDPAFGPYTSGRYRVSWRSAAEALQHYGFAAVVAPGNHPAFTLNYSMGGVLDLQDGTGVVHSGIPYTPGVAQRFEALIDLDARTFDLWVDGVRIASARPFQDERFTALERFLWEIGGVEAEAYAIADVGVSCFAFSDVTPPETTLSVSSGPDAAGWSRGPVTVAVSARDGCAGSGVKELHLVAGGVETVARGAAASLEVVAEGQTAISAFALDEAGNREVAQRATATVRIDRTPPTIAFGGSCPATATLRAGAALHVSVSDDTSAIASQSVPNGAYPLDTSTVGTKSLRVTATDLAGNTSASACTYRVIYDFLGTGGFAAPVKAPPAVNAVKGGSAVPLKWQLRDAGGGWVGELGAVTAIRFQEAACQGFGALENALPADASATGAPALRYDAATNQFAFNWKTSSAMAGGCYVLTLRLDDGSEYSANFSVK